MVKKANKKNEEIQDCATPEELREVQNEINEELIKEKKEQEKEKKNNPSYLFLTFFIKRLKEDKLYLFSFIITLVFLGIFSFKKLQSTDGYYDRKNDTKVNDNAVVPTVNTDLNQDDKNNTQISDELDITDYIGIYSKEITMSSPVVINNTCSITSYKLVYQIKKDKSIIKYFMNDCAGTIKIWEDKLNYVSSGGARYISANNINYLFSSNNMKEVDGDTYKVDDEVNVIKINKKINDLNLYFLDSNVVLVTNTDLISIKGSSINYQLSQKYEVNRNVLDKIVYESSTKNQFKFIIFNKEETKTCYDSEELVGDEFKDDLMYKIYLIKYDEETQTLSEEKEIISRNKTDGCEKYKDDLENLKE